ncbi:MAG: hypothetical protein EAZ85_08330 [Bacteroidetes bacterium]|nr:MAG: hypothetical protein EAZ85_08330 [Bacteroidota bacterium]TAG89205.1 MAG: hypothetical protein EAZ20_06985 [Bacteroidota bacterium]
MLHKETVEPTTLELLNNLMQVDELKEFALLCGTSLSLRWGHRKSEDIDLFSNINFNEELVIDALESYFSNCVIDIKEKQTIRIFIDDVKVEIIAPKKKYLKPFEIIDSIRFFSVDDTMAFKMNAIERRGSKKDFYDLYEALKYYELHTLIYFYTQKFETSNSMQLLKSITYFEDAENQPQPILFENIDWQDVKNTIKIKFNHYINTQI